MFLAQCFTIPCLHPLTALQPPKPKIPAPEVQGPPEIKLVDNDKSIFIRIGCKSSEIPELSWFLNDKPIKADRRIKFDCPLDRGVFYASMKLTQVQQC